MPEVCERRFGPAKSVCCRHCAWPFINKHKAGESTSHSLAFSKVILCSTIQLDGKPTLRAIASSPPALVLDTPTAPAPLNRI
jgi:hypothetical protein